MTVLFRQLLLRFSSPDVYASLYHTTLDNRKWTVGIARSPRPSDGRGRG